ncbi:unnamed protein product, partial [Prorocentrum cordatum]
AKEKEGGKARETAVAQRGAASCESGPAFSPRAPQHRPLMPPALDGPATFRGRLAMSDCQEPKGGSAGRPRGLGAALQCGRGRKKPSQGSQPSEHVQQILQRLRKVIAKREEQRNPGYPDEKKTVSR